MHDLLVSSEISVPFSKSPVRGTVAQVPGDSLGLHTLLGNVESFSANYLRFCVANKDATKNYMFSIAMIWMTLQ